MTAKAAQDAQRSYLDVGDGIKDWFVTDDHKRIGLMYLIALTTSLGLGGVAALLVRLELMTPTEAFLSAELFGKAFTLYGVALVFLFLIPSIPAVLGNFFLPIMLGAKGVAFPKLNLAGFYLYVVGAILALVSVGISAGTGWTFYPPLSLTATGIIPMAIAIIALGLSSVLTGVNFIATVHRMRAPSLRWSRLPLFAWGIYVTAAVHVFAMSVLAVTFVLVILEKVQGIGLFDPSVGGDPVLFQHLFWFSVHPAVYITLLPGMAVVSEIIATFSRRRIVGYGAMAASTVALGLLVFLGWGHHMFTAGMSEYATMVFSALTFLLVIPCTVKVGNWIATLYNGSISLQSPMLYALAFIVFFTIGGLTGLFLNTIAVGVYLEDTYFAAAHFHFLMVGGTVVAMVGGLHYWWPKMTGKTYSETLAKAAFGLIFVGFNVTFLTQLLLGSQGAVSRSHTYAEEFQSLQGISSAGSIVLGLGFVVMIAMFIKSLRGGAKAPPNPWGSAGYEWATSSPPSVENFGDPLTVDRGPYDYHLATDDELYDGFSGEAPVTATAPAKSAAKEEAKSAAKEEAKSAAKEEEE